jgi:hypothetical protein
VSFVKFVDKKKKSPLITQITRKELVKFVKSVDKNLVSFVKFVDKKKVSTNYTDYTKRISDICEIRGQKLSVIREIRG